MTSQSVFEYLDFREFLSDYYTFRKAQDSSFSYRSFSASLGIKAPNFLQWIIDGKRDLSLKNIKPISTILNLDDNEADYFDTLVRFGQAKTVADKDLLFNLLLEKRKPFVVSTLDEYQYEHFNNWYNEVIRVLLNMVDFNPNEKYAFRRLAAMLRPKISETQARSAIKKMLLLGLVKKDNSGFIRQTDRIISTGDEVKSFFIKRFHGEMIDLAKDSMNSFSSDERDISAITMNVSDKCFELIKKEIQQTRKRILELVEIDEQSNNLYQLNMQLFPVARKDNDNDN